MHRFPIIGSLVLTAVALLLPSCGVRLSHEASAAPSHAAFPVDAVTESMARPLSAILPFVPFIIILALSAYVVGLHYNFAIARLVGKTALIISVLVVVVAIVIVALPLLSSVGGVVVLIALMSYGAYYFYRRYNGKGK
jgi:hypothetical protein